MESIAERKRTGWERCNFALDIPNRQPAPAAMACTDRSNASGPVLVLAALPAAHWWLRRAGIGEKFSRGTSFMKIFRCYTSTTRELTEWPAGMACSMFSPSPVPISPMVPGCPIPWPSRLPAPTFHPRWSGKERRPAPSATL